MELVKILIAITFISGIAGCNDSVSNDAGCIVYESRLPLLPRPVENTPLGHWVAGTDSAMLATCRKLSSENWYE